MNEESNRKEIVRNMIELIETAIATDTWSKTKGQRQAIREISDMLVVKQTPDTQAEIAALLQEFDRRKGETVRTESIG